jgi:hypothetical protein
MRSLEMHMFETEHDVEIAIRSGIVLPEQLASSRCIQCSDGVGYSGPEYLPFLLVIDENDQDWLLCTECAGPIFNYVDASFPPLVHRPLVEYEDLEDLEYF